MENRTLFYGLMATAMMIGNPMAAETINLNFDQTSNNTGFHTAGNLVMNYLDVADGLNATIVAQDTFYSNNPDHHGVHFGDAQINMGVYASQTFVFSLWDATLGDGFSTLFDPLGDFSFTLGFYDIDGTETLHQGSWDVLSFDSAVSYMVSDTTKTSPTVIGDQVVFTGKDTMDNVSNNFTRGFTQEQRDATVLVNLENQSTFTFTYGVETEDGVDGRAGRNLAIDGNDFRLVLDPPGPPAVPLPAGGLLLLTALGGIAALRKR